MNMKQMQQGFTLIELMIVIAILGILAAIAIPTYQDYMVRAKVSEAVAVASAAKVGVAEYRQTKNVMPTDRTQAGASNVVTTYVSGLNVGANGVITISVNQTNTGIPSGTLSIVLTPTMATGAVKYTCTTGGTTSNAKYAPASCR